MSISKTWDVGTPRNALATCMVWQCKHWCLAKETEINTAQWDLGFEKNFSYVRTY